MKLIVPLLAVLAAIALTSSEASAGDLEDCQSGKLPAAQVIEACRRASRALLPYPSGTTRIIGEFNGCEYGKIYRLFNGYDLVCNSYGYRYSYQPEVVILDSGTAIIDGQRFNVSFR